MKPTLHILQIASPDRVLQAQSGELILLTGANGSGKSLWLKRLAGLCPLPAGVSATIDGKPYTDAATPQIRMLFDRYPPIWLGQHVAEELSFGLPAPPSAETMAGKLAQWGIPELSPTDEPEKLNRLQGLRLSLAAMDMAEPELVLLDNPTASLSETDAKVICNAVASWAKAANLVVVVACNRWQDWQAAVAQIWCVQTPDGMPQLGEQT